MNTLRRLAGFTQTDANKNTNYLNEIDQKIQPYTDLRDEIYRPGKGETFGIRRRLAQMAVGNKFVSDNDIIHFAPEHRKDMLDLLVKGVRKIDDHTGLGHEAARGVANAAIGAYQFNERLKQFDQALKDWNEFKNRQGGKTRKKRCRRSKYTRKSSRVFHQNEKVAHNRK